MASERQGPVPLCDLMAQYQTLKPEIDAAVLRVLNSGQAILGPEVAQLEKEVADYCGVRHAIGCGSGTEAISLALHGLKIGPGDEVILPPFTFFATAGCVVRAGAIPVFVDIDPETFNICPKAVARAVTPRTRAIMPVHLFGQCVDMDEIAAIASQHDLPIIEDAAQAYGSEYRGQKAGGMGKVGCFSFYPTKNLGTFGDAGMVVTNDDALAERITCLRVHGMKPKYFHPMLGWNGRIDAIHAAILRVKQPRVEQWLKNREQAAQRYDTLLAEQKLLDFVSRPIRRAHRRHTFNQYVIRVADGHRDALVRHFQAAQVGCEIYYPQALHMQECLQHLGYRQGDFPVSETACREVMALPIYPEITPELQARVVNRIADYVAMPRRAAA